MICNCPGLDSAFQFFDTSSKSWIEISGKIDGASPRSGFQYVMASSASSLYVIGLYGTLFFPCFVSDVIRTLQILHGHRQTLLNSLSSTSWRWCGRTTLQIWKDQCLVACKAVGMSTSSKSVKERSWLLHTQRWWRLTWIPWYGRTSREGLKASYYAWGIDIYHLIKSKDCGRFKAISTVRSRFKIHPIFWSIVTVENLDGRSTWQLPTRTLICMMLYSLVRRQTSDLQEADTLHRCGEIWCKLQRDRSTHTVWVDTNNHRSIRHWYMRRRQHLCLWHTELRFNN